MNEQIAKTGKQDKKNESLAMLDKIFKSFRWSNGSSH